MKRILILTKNGESKYYSSLKILCEKNKDITDSFPEFNERNIGNALRKKSFTKKTELTHLKNFYCKNNIQVHRVEINV
jgi:hypothetical protein